jgi:hypothetical protein
MHMILPSIRGLVVSISILNEHGTHVTKPTGNEYTRLILGKVFIGAFTLRWVCSAYRILLLFSRFIVTADLIQICSRHRQSIYLICLSTLIPQNDLIHIRTLRSSSSMRRMISDIFDHPQLHCSYTVVARGNIRLHS